MAKLTHDQINARIDLALKSYGFEPNELNGEMREAAYGLLDNSTNKHYQQGVLDMMINVAGAE